MRRAPFVAPRDRTSLERQRSPRDAPPEGIHDTVVTDRLISENGGRIAPFESCETLPSRRQADPLGQQFVGSERVVVIGNGVLDHHLVDADAVGELL